MAILNVFKTSQSDFRKITLEDKSTSGFNILIEFNTPKNFKTKVGIFNILSLAKMVDPFNHVSILTSEGAIYQILNNELF